MKREISFTIHGNQTDPKKGNPIPYLRMTQGSKWSDPAVRYHGWCDYVRRLYKEASGYVAPNERSRYTAKEYREMVHEFEPKKPIPGSPKGRTTVTIYFGTENHADPDNVVKGINDALFENDKHIDVSTSHSCKNAEPRVEVTIELQ